MHAQLETSKWCFGINHTVDFASGTPKVIQPSGIFGQEGSASVADVNGNLLFYTSGDTVWSKNHQMMQNGGGLLGNQTPVQPAIILKKPGSTNLYYLFTVQGIGGSAGCRYSIIDMQLNGGLGAVVSKNLVLYGQPCTEGITAALHCNGQDYWVIIHQDSSTVFRSYLFTSSGLSSAVTSSVGSINRYESLKMSLDGTMLATAGVIPTGGVSEIRVHKFDRSAGTVNVAFFSTVQNGICAYLEFSPDGKALYTNNRYNTFQWNLCAGSNSAIANSCYTIVPQIQNNSFQMQVALNGKIYMSRNFYPLLGIINNPNALGANCNFKDTAVVLKNNGIIGLPNMPSFYLRHLSYSPYTYTTSHTSNDCFKVDFSPNAQPLGCSNTSSMSFNAWHFGDPNSGALNVSNSPNASHAYKQPGNYTAWLLLQNTCGGIDSIPQMIQVPYSLFGPSVTVQTPSIMCIGETAPVTLSGAASYTLNQLPVTNNPFVLTPTQPTTYTITASNANQCISKTTFSVQVDPCSGILEHSPTSFIKIEGHTLKIYTQQPAQNVHLYNLQGQRLLSASLGDSSNDKTIDLLYLSEGVYVVSDGEGWRKIFHSPN